jgi:hypothetical protein
MRGLIGFILMGLAAFAVVSGLMGTLTPSDGLPPLRDIGLFAALPLIVMMFAIGITQNAMLRLVFVLIFLAAIGALGYTGLVLFV